jgi:hypothetical protein
MPLGKVLYESGDELHHAYFPTTCIVSKLYVMENGASAEIAVIGNSRPERARRQFPVNGWLTLEKRSYRDRQ